MSDVQRAWVEVMAKHLPPSGVNLRLLDVEGHAGNVLIEIREDVDILLSPGAGDEWQVALDSIDAVMAYAALPTPHLLREALEGLRPGGRLIIAHPELTLSEDWVRLLEAAGYVRILVEAGEGDHPGLLMRGEKPHTEERTTDRVKQVAERDNKVKAPSRYVYLLVIQSPNKPAWALTPDDHISWEALAVRGQDETVILAFSSLPKAVEFMQPAVVSGRIQGVNKVAKFRWDVVKNWPYDFLLNPSDDLFEQSPIVQIPVDASLAEKPDE